MAFKINQENFEMNYRKYILFFIFIVFNILQAGHDHVEVTINRHQHIIPLGIKEVLQNYVSVR